MNAQNMSVPSYNMCRIYVSRFKELSSHFKIFVVTTSKVLLDSHILTHHILCVLYLEVGVDSA